MSKFSQSPSAFRQRVPACRRVFKNKILPTRIRNRCPSGTQMSVRLKLLQNYLIPFFKKTDIKPVLFFIRWGKNANKNQQKDMHKQKSQEKSLILTMENLIQNKKGSKYI